MGVRGNAAHDAVERKSDWTPMFPGNRREIRQYKERCGVLPEVGRGPAAASSTAPHRNLFIMGPQQHYNIDRAQSRESHDIEKKEEDYVEAVTVLADGDHQAPSPYTEEEEAFLAAFDDKRKKKMYRKIDMRLLPMLGMLYLFACKWTAWSLHGPTLTVRHRPRQHR